MQRAEMMTEPTSRAGGFAGDVTTHWSQVLRAGDPDDPGALECLDALVRRYESYGLGWLRGKFPNVNPDLLRDVWQEFFKSVIERQSLRELRDWPGRFRDWLRACLRHRTQDLLRRLARERNLVPLDTEEGIDGTRWLVAPDEAADKAAVRRYVADLFNHALAVLRREHAADPADAAFFAECEPCLASGDRLPAGDVAARLGWRENTVSAAYLRLRGRFRRIAVEHLAADLAAGEDPEAELRELLLYLAADN